MASANLCAVFAEPSKRRKHNVTSTGNQTASALPTGPSDPPPVTPSISTQTAMQLDIQVDDAVASRAGGAASAADDDEQPATVSRDFLVRALSALALFFPYASVR